MNIKFGTTIVETDGVRTIAGGGTGKSTALTPSDVGAAPDTALQPDDPISELTVLTGTFIPAVTRQLKTGLLAHWKLDETSGARADSNGTNALTDNESVGYEAGKIGNAAVFSGTNWLSDSSISTTGLTALSRNIWIKANAEDNGVVHFFSMSAGDGFGTYTSSGLVYLFTNTENGSVNLSLDAMDGTWHMLTSVYDGVNVVLYQDGAYVTETNLTGGILATTSGVDLGGLNGGYLFTGSLDSASIWDRALTEAEITALYNAGSGKDYEGFDEILVPAIPITTDGQTAMDGKAAIGLAAGLSIALG